MDKTFYTEENPIRFPYAAKYEGEEKPYSGFCKLTLNDGTVVELEGSGALTPQMTTQYKSKIINVNIGDECTQLSDSVFGGCTNLTNIKIPNSVVSIGDSVFSNCRSLTDIEIPDSVTQMSSCFQQCSKLTTVTLSNNISRIRPTCFVGCTNLKKIVIPKSVKTIGNAAFAGCESLTEVVIPEGVEEIANDAFSGCLSLTSITIPNSVSSIDRPFGTPTMPQAYKLENVYYYAKCSLPSCIIPQVMKSGIKKIVIGGSTTQILYGAFSNCAVRDLIIDDPVAQIGDGAFCNTALTSVIIPGTVSSIGVSAFANNSLLQSVTIKSVTPPDIKDNTFQGNSADMKFYVPAGAVDTYKAASVWSQYADKIYPIQNNN